MFDLMALAFQADVTRIATFLYANEASNQSYHFHRSPRGTSRPLAPRRRPREAAKIRMINQFHVEQFAYLLGKLEGDP